ncbi:uncharacterized protein LOC141899231 [Tubulanus polymorphus]|uniref:uncharacterized protein LOC141899231 n=1 Tax=Tubulanus polymorphus TaxID=672921 RepID=UPI003DA6A028
MIRENDTSVGKAVEERKEFAPLLMPVSHPVKKNVINYEANCSENEETAEFSDKVLFIHQKKTRTSLLFNDSLILVLEFLQLFALLQSLSLRWPWPPMWVRNFNFLMLFNFDVWEFIKVHTNGTYKSVKDYYTPSDTVPIPFWSILLTWGLIIVFLGVAYVAAYITLHKKNGPFLFVQLARMQRVYIILVQVLAVPIGVTLGKLFHRDDKGQLDVDNKVIFGGVIHLSAYVVPSILFSTFFFVVPTIFFVKITRRETLRMGTKKHEQFLQLKELEYNHRMDMLWQIAHYHIFSSFKKFGTYYRAGVHIGKLILLIVYAGLFQFTLPQAVVVTLVLAIMLVTFCVIRPFRVRSFNSMLMLNYLCLSAVSLMGALIASYNPYTVQSPWFTPNYSFWVIILIASIWLICALVFFIHIALRYHGLCICFKRPLWPLLTSEGLNKLGPYTKKYLKAMLRSRRVLEKTLAMPPIFAPVHDLVREIRIINAYAREAEYLKDPIHDSLLDVLDELIDCHGELAPRSLFAASIKDSIRQTSAMLMDMMPKFVHCLAQREYDFLLMNPVKRRLLLKMYCMGVFLNGRADKVKKKQELAPAVEKVWIQRDEDAKSEAGYYGDMYPEPVLPSFQPYNKDVSADILLSDDDDDEYLAMLDEWAANNPLSRQDRLNESLVNLLEEWKDVQSGSRIPSTNVTPEPMPGISNETKLLMDLGSNETGIVNMAYHSDEDVEKIVQLPETEETLIDITPVTTAPKRKKSMNSSKAASRNLQSSVDEAETERMLQDEESSRQTMNENPDEPAVDIEASLPRKGRKLSRKTSRMSVKSQNGNEGDKQRSKSVTRRETSEKEEPVVSTESKRRKSSAKSSPKTPKKKISQFAKNEANKSDGYVEIPKITTQKICTGNG